MLLASVQMPDDPSIFNSLEYLFETILTNLLKVMWTLWFSTFSTWNMFSCWLTSKEFFWLDVNSSLFFFGRLQANVQLISRFLFVLVWVCSRRVSLCLPLELFGSVKVSYIGTQQTHHCHIFWSIRGQKLNMCEQQLACFSSNAEYVGEKEGVNFGGRKQTCNYNVQSPQGRGEKERCLIL